MKDNDDILSRAEKALLEIIRGYSVLRNKNGKCFFKHYSIIENLEFEESYREYLASAVKSGIKDEKIILQEAIKKKKWSVAQEEEIKSLIWTADKLEEVSKKIQDPTQKIAARDNVAGKRRDLEILNAKKKEICSYSAETFAETKKMKQLVCRSLFKDETFTEKFEGEEALAYIQEFFNKIGELCNSRVIANAAYNSNFFEIFSLNYRQPSVIFPNQGMNLTVFQKNLLTYANSILSRLKNMPIPEEITNDPVKILNYREPEVKTDGQTSYGLEDLKQKSAAKGGKLDAEDFLS